MFRLIPWILLASVSTFAFVSHAEDDPKKQCKDKLDKVKDEAAKRAGKAKSDSDGAAQNLGGKLKGAGVSEGTAGEKGSKIQSDAKDDLEKKKKECECEKEKKQADNQKDKQKAQKDKEDMEKEEGMCAGLIAALMGELGGGMGGNQTAQNGGNNSSKEASTGMPPMVIPPIPPSDKKNDATPPKPDNQIAALPKTDDQKCTPQTVGTAAAGPGCVADLMSKGECTGECQAAFTEACKSNPHQDMCLAGNTQKVCQQMLDGGGSPPPGCGTVVANADNTGIRIQTAGAGGTTGSGSGSGLPAGAGAATGVTAQSVGAERNERKASANREGMGLGTEGGGGGGYGSGSSSESESELKERLNSRGPASEGPAKLAGLSPANAVSEIGGNKDNILKIVGEVYHQRCLAGKFRHCEPFTK